MCPVLLIDEVSHASSHISHILLKNDRKTDSDGELIPPNWYMETEVEKIL